MKAGREARDGAADRETDASPGPPPGRAGPLRNVATGRTRRLLDGGPGPSVGDVPVVSNRSLARGRAETRDAQIHVAHDGDGPAEEVLAHETAHAMQQRAAAGLPEGSRAALEADAARVARATMAGRAARPLLRAPRRSRLGYEAWEHTAIGDARGGADVTVVTRSGVELTYGQIVALSGDFYRSPAALMNAPAAELNELKAIMGDEAAAAEESPRGRPSQEQIAGYTERYELATSRRGSQAEYHRHDDLETLDEHGGHGGHEDHGGHGGGHEGELVESAGRDAAHGVPEPDASFIELAAKNASHFSPENIENNYRPGQERALELAHRAWQLRNPGAEPAGTTAGTRPSAREEALPPTGAAAFTGPLQPGGPDTTARRVDATSDDEAERLEAHAWLTNGWANHYLTDAFAAGHLVNGNVGRRAGVAFVRQRRGEVARALSLAMLADLPVSPAQALGLAHGLLAGLEEAGKLGSMALKLVHDVLNEAGLWVKDALGTQWVTVGDKVLATSPQTQARAEEASRTSRAAVQDVLRTGGTDQQMRALDLIPDVASFGGSAYQPIAAFAEDPQVFTACFERTMLAPSPEQNGLYEMIAGNVGLLGVMGEQLWIRHGEPVVDEAAERGGGLLDRVRRGAAETAEDIGQGVTGLGSWLEDTGEGLVEGIGRGVSDARTGITHRLLGLQRRADAAWSAVEQASDEGTTIDVEEAGVADRFLGWLGDRRDHVAELVDPGASPATGETAVEPVHNQTYMHGAGMGMAGSFMQDSTWSSILARLMPDVYRRATSARTPKDLMIALENNPVLAAYSTARHEALMPPRDVASSPPVRMEWDVWLDPDDPRDLDGARISHGNMPTTIGHASDPTNRAYHQRPEVQEGPSVSGWMQDYALALEMAGAASPDVPGPDLTVLSSSSSPADALHMTADTPEVLAAPGGVFLDVKSRYSRAGEIAAFIDEVESTGVNIIGVGTFQYEQIDEQGGAARTAAPMHVKFTQGVGDMEAAIEDGRIGRGDQVMFNGGDLLSWTPVGRTLDTSDLDLVRRRATDLDLEMGIYVQEYGVGPEVVGQLTELVNRESELFGLGFAYGAVSGRATTGVEGSGFPLGQRGAEAGASW